MPRRTGFVGNEWEMRKQTHWHHGTGKLIVGLFILLIGISWLGHDLGWWAFTLPWVPLAVTLIGLALILGWVRKQEYV